MMNYNERSKLLFLTILLYCGSPMYMQAQQTLQKNTTGQGKTITDSIKAKSEKPSVLLEEVRVTAARPLIKAGLDKLTYNVASDPDSKSMSILEMLRKVPLVTVEGNDAIKVNGNGDFKVYVNGKPNSMMTNRPSDIFRGMPASSVKKIEVITDPGAKYDAEGTAGVLNIITETGTKLEGYNLGLNAGVTNIAQMSNLSGIIKAGKLTFSLNYGMNYVKPPKGYQETERIMYADENNYRLFSHADYHMKALAQYAELAGSYEFDKYNLLSVSAGAEYYDRKSRTDMQTRMYDKSGQETYSYFNEHISKEKSNGYYAGVDYQHTFGQKAGSVTFSCRYASAPSPITSSSLYSDIRNYPQNQGLTDLQSVTDMRSDECTGQADYTVTLNKLHTVSVGGKYIRRVNRSNNHESYRAAGTEDPFMGNPDQTLLYRQTNNIAAAYAEYQVNLKKFSARAGVRYEHSGQSVDYPGEHTAAHGDFSADFNNLVPSVSVGYRLSETKMLKFAYNMRISRPNIWNLNPYADHSDPTVVKKGNPDLKTATSHGVGLTFNSFTRKFSVNASVGFDMSDDGISNYSYMDADVPDIGLMATDAGNILVRTYGNILSWKDLYASLYLNYMLTKTTVLTVNARGAYTDFKSNQLQQHNYGYTGNVSVFLQQHLPWKLNFSAAYAAISQGINLQGHSNGSSSCRFTLMRSFLKEDRLSISIYGTNIFSKELRMENVTQTSDFNNRFTNVRRDYRMYGVTVSLRLGKLRAKVKRTAKSIRNDDVIQDGNPTENK